MRRALRSAAAAAAAALLLVACASGPSAEDLQSLVEERLERHAQNALTLRAFDMTAQRKVGDAYWSAVKGSFTSSLTDYYNLPAEAVVPPGAYRIAHVYDFAVYVKTVKTDGDWTIAASQSGRPQEWE
ncbi:MAG: hypothetical protein C4523_20735 [Myxococcales bacterium]|nr:MAG: hypothetical protein C4523_20735 [Myxococcales bacterium]